MTEQAPLDTKVMGLDRTPRPMRVTLRDVAGILALAVGTPLGMAAIIWIGGGVP